MKIRHLIILLLVGLLATSCATPQLQYFQNMTAENSVVALQQLKQIHLKEGDRITILVHSKEPAMAAAFNLTSQSNTSSTYGGGTKTVTGGTSMSNSNREVYYTIDTEGNIDFPILGTLHAAGMTRSELAAFIKGRIIQSGQLKDPTVNVDFAGLYIDVLGDVGSPGRQSIDKDQITILEAISQAGDLNITARREKVSVIRQEGGEMKRYFVNIADAQSVFQSPVYYLQQGDLVYVEPNDTKMRTSTANGNTFHTASFWISMVSFIASMTSIVVNLAK